MKKILISMSLMSLIFTLAIIGFGNNPTQAATYTKENVALHNTASDCWMIINNNVYNLTSFVNTHSGGSAVIIGQCGKDGTAVFNSGPHSSSTINTISSMMLGKLILNTDPNPTPTPIPDPLLILTSVSISPTSPIVDINGTLQIIVTPKDQNGLSITGAITTFASSNHNAAIVNNKTGLIKGIASGSTTITTTSIRGSKTITSHVLLVVSGTTVAPTPEPTPTQETSQLPTLKYYEDGDSDEIEYEHDNQKTNWSTEDITNERDDD
jgi:hypothetical protein